MSAPIIELRGADSLTQSVRSWRAHYRTANLRYACSEMTEFSSRNLKHTGVFGAECPCAEIGQQSADQLPWFHIATLLTKVADEKLPEWYVREGSSRGWAPEDNRLAIGLLLCPTQNRMVAEYALSGIEKPIGVAEYQLVRALPDPLDVSLPSIEEIEAELSRGLVQGDDDDDDVTDESSSGELV